MNLCIGIAVSSSLQIGLLVTPVLVLVGWMIDQPLSLYFENFETVILFTSVLIVNYLIQDGRSNWLEGALLLVSFIFYYLSRHSLHLIVILCNYSYGILLPPLKKESCMLQVKKKIVSHIHIVLFVLYSPFFFLHFFLFLFLFFFFVVEFYKSVQYGKSA